jgi:hypothetical protein
VEQVWREERMSALLAEDAAESLFILGCVSNQGKFYDRFDAVVLLSVPVDVLLERLATRVTNPFGKDAAERERILEDLHNVEPLLRATLRLRSTLSVRSTRLSTQSKRSSSASHGAEPAQ